MKYFKNKLIGFIVGLALVMGGCIAPQAHAIEYHLNVTGISNTWLEDQTFSGQILAKDGAAASPSYSFSSYATTGFYIESINTVRYSYQGIANWKFSNAHMGGAGAGYSGFRFVVASATAPNVVMSEADTDTGLGQKQADAITFVAGGIEGPGVAASGGIAALYIKETAEPAAESNYGTIWASAANTLNFIDGAGTNHILGGSDHAEMYDEDNTDVFVVNATSEIHAYHTNALTYLHLESTWTFDGGGAGSSVAIASIADGGGGEIAVTTGAVHGLAVGDIISQTNLSDAAYVGVFVVNTVTSTTIYEVTAVYTATDTGTMDQAATLTAETGASGDYQVIWNASATGAGSNETFDFELCNNGVVITGTKARRKFGTGGDFGVVGGSSIVTIAVGDKVTFALNNTSSAGNITLRNFMFYLLKI